MKILAILGAVGVLIAILVASYISAYNFGNQMEKQVTYEYENLNQIYGNYGMKIQELVQVPAMKAKDLQKVVEGAMSGRYGENGSQATMQWIVENYPGQVTDALYQQVSDAIRAGRDEFQVWQTRFIDIKRTYDTALGSFWKGMWLKIAGYPKIELKDFKTVTTNKAKQAFDTGTDTPLQLMLQ